MGLRKRNQITGRTVFFVTTSTLNHQKLFKKDNIKDRVLALLIEAANDHDIKIMAYVIMPDHLHLVVICNEGGKQLSKFMHSLKGRIRTKLFGDYKIWQDRFDDLVLYTERQFLTKARYIHNNPVKAGFVNEPVKYVYSGTKAWELGKSDFLCFEFEK